MLDVILAVIVALMLFASVWCLVQATLWIL